MYSSIVDNAYGELERGRRDLVRLCCFHFAFFGHGEVRIDRRRLKQMDREERQSSEAIALRARQPL